MLFTIVDAETTSKWVNKAEILELGYMQVNEKLEIIRYGNLYFYKSEFDIENEAQAVHKLQRSFLEKYESSFTENIIKLYTLTQKSILVGKNSDRYDIPLIINFLKRHAPELDTIEVVKSIDIQEKFKKRFREYYKAQHNGETTRKFGTLTELMDVIGYTQERVLEEFKNDLGGCEGREQAHSALYDVYMTYLLMKFAVVNGDIVIHEEYSKKQEEALWERTRADIADMCEEVIIDGFVDMAQYLECFQHCIRHYNISGSTCPNIGMSGAQIIKRLGDVNFQEAFVKLDAANLGFIPVDSMFNLDIRHVCYMLTNIYLFTGDAIFMLLMRILLSHGKFAAKRIVQYKGDAFNCSKRAHQDSTIITYLDYDAFRNKEWPNLSRPVDLNNPADVNLFKNDPRSFWRKAIPHEQVLYAELAYGIISWDAESIYGLLIMLAKREDF